MRLSQARASHRARFVEVQVRADGPRCLRVECAIQNRSSVTWTERLPSAASGNSAPQTLGPVWLGYQVFDARTGLRVMDGARSPLGEEWKPGEVRPVTAEIQLPPGDGSYRIVISPVQEGVAWFHERGSEFLEVEVASSPDGVNVRSVRRATRTRQRARRIVQLLVRFFGYPARRDRKSVV